MTSKGIIRLKGYLAPVLGTAMLVLTGCGSSSSDTNDTVVTAGAVNTQMEVELTSSVSAVHGSIDYLRSLLFIEPIFLPEQDGVSCETGSVTTSVTETTEGSTQTRMSFFFDQCLLASGTTLDGAASYVWSNSLATDAVVFLDSASSRFEGFTITLADSDVPVAMQGELATSYSKDLTTGSITRSTQSVTANNTQVDTVFTISYKQRKWLLADYALVERESADGTVEIEFRADMTDATALVGETYSIDTVQSLTLIPNDPAPRSGEMVVTSGTDAVTLNVISAENVSLVFDLGADGVADESVDMSWTQLINY